jgi:transcriptional regulator with XRE-family HTH domain
MKDDTSVKIGKKLREIRTHRNWTQEYMAERLNLDANYYATVERGEKLFSLSTFITVLDTLNVSANDLIPHSPKESSTDTTLYKKEINEILDHCSESQYIAIIKILKAIDGIN